MDVVEKINAIWEAGHSREEKALAARDYWQEQFKVEMANLNQALDDVEIHLRDIRLALLRIHMGDK